VLVRRVLLYMLGIVKTAPKVKKLRDDLARLLDVNPEDVVLPDLVVK
jgi:hypothetical protein